MHRIDGNALSDVSAHIHMLTQPATVLLGNGLAEVIEKVVSSKDRLCIGAVGIGSDQNF